MADASDRTSLPIRVHEFLLGLAGRIDDDALTDARELLAVAELDRAIELVAGSLVAGRLPVTLAERGRLRDLINEVHCAPALAERLVITEDVPRPRHRFTPGTEDDPRPDRGVLEAADRVLSVLPDIRSVFCVWRTTPAGATSGPVPQRLVLIETGADGFAPSTAYRVEQALRRVGMNAVVEVLAAGADHGEYHRAALAVARRVSGRGASDPRDTRDPRNVRDQRDSRDVRDQRDVRESRDVRDPRESRPPSSTPPPPPSVPARSAAPAVAPAVPPEPVPSAVESPSAAPSEAFDSSSLDPPAPRSVTSTRRRSAHAAPDRRPAVGSASGRWQQRIAGAVEPGRPAERPADASAATHSQPVQQTPQSPQAAQPSQATQQGQLGQPERSGERTRPNTSLAAASGTKDRLTAAREPDGTGQALPTAVPPPLAPPNGASGVIAGTTSGYRQPSREHAVDPSRSAQQQPQPKAQQSQPQPAQPQPQQQSSAASPPAASATPATGSAVAPGSPATPSAGKPAVTPPSTPGVGQASAQNRPVTPPTAGSSTSTGAAAGKASSRQSAEDDLSQRERDLLRQLHEELAKREQSGQASGQDESSARTGWHVDKSANRQSPFANPTSGPGALRPETAATGHWQAAATTSETTVNGVPPYGTTS